ncbi:TPA: hypothetical protein DEG21_01810 [Patescibacteria group bacterium]|nr:hypothetical protein [Candidatus Gracilibacteria bacterium]HBY74623.1 hypothetical protein [Candidatus Gracilibacteria bacterium]
MKNSTKVKGHSSFCQFVIHIFPEVLSIFVTEKTHFSECSGPLFVVSKLIPTSILYCFHFSSISSSFSFNSSSVLISSSFTSCFISHFFILSANTSFSIKTQFSNFSRNL